MKKSRFILMVPALLMGLGLTMVSCSDDDDDDVVATTPAATDQSKYETALADLYPDATDVKWETEQSYQVAEFTKNFTTYDVWFDKDAKSVMTEKDYGKNIFLVMDNQVSSAWSTGEYATWTLDDISHYIRQNDEFYVFEVSKTGESDMDLYYNTEGTLLKAIPEDQAPEITPSSVI